jgi:hypothetical protein
LAGRQSGSSSSSLFVQLVTDTVYRTLDGLMNVPPIVVSDTMNMDAVIGMMFYSFGNFRLLPRNNDDFVGINVVLDSTNLPTSPISIQEFETIPGVRMYPNPAQQWVSIELDDQAAFNISVFDMHGKIVIREDAQGKVLLNLGNLQNGIYLVSLTDEDGRTHHSKLIITK